MGENKLLDLDRTPAFRCVIMSIRRISLCLWFTAYGCVAPSATLWHDPLTFQEHEVLGNTYLQQGKVQAARREFAAIIDRAPRHVPALFATGNIAFETHDYLKAEECYRRVLDQQPQHAAAANNLAMVYVTIGTNLDEAERLARQALAQSSVQLKPYIKETLASVLIKQERWGEARTVLEEAMSLADSSKDALTIRLNALHLKTSLHRE